MKPPNITIDIDNLKDLDIEQLQIVQRRLTKFVEQRLENKKQEALDEIKRLVKLHELSLEEVTKSIRTSARRGKAPPVYRNPERPRQTWSGIGTPPDWYTNHPDPESLKIKD